MAESAVSVSVLTPTLNYGRFLGAAIASVEEQRHDGLHVQHVVQDGGSADRTLEILGAHPSVEWRSEPDAGQSDALNRALERASGEWIAWLNADEFYLPGALHRLTRIGVAEGADVVYGDIVDVDAQGRLMRVRPQHALDVKALRWFGPHVASCGVVFRRSALVPPVWDPELKVSMDWDLYLTLASRGAAFRYEPFPVSAFGRHDAQVAARPELWDLDDAAIERRHALGRSWSRRKMGRLRHIRRKLAEGAYLRQLRGRRPRGTDLRWFDDEVGRGGFDALVQRCYPRSAPR